MPSLLSSVFFFLYEWEIDPLVFLSEFVVGSNCFNATTLFILHSNSFIHSFIHSLSYDIETPCITRMEIGNNSFVKATLAPISGSINDLTEPHLINETLGNLDNFEKVITQKEPLNSNQYSLIMEHRIFAYFLLHLYNSILPSKRNSDWRRLF